MRRAEFANAPLSHHLIISAAEPGSPADQKLREYTVGDQVPCLNAETAFGSEGMYWAGCQCGACASALIKCATDADCKPILDCVASGSQQCREVADQHSSAVGLSFQTQACLQASDCAASCPE